MKYRGISNNPQARARITSPYVTWTGGFTEEQVNKIAAYCQQTELEAGITWGGLNEDIRTSKINWQAWCEEIAWFFDGINELITRINNGWYGFDLNGYQHFQYAEYSAEEKGKFDWHMDLFMGNEIPKGFYEPRKLSITVLLNEPGVDFEGGEFQFKYGVDEHTVDCKKGHVIAFPSWMIHRVTPVTKGVRKSIVIWVEGPKFV